LHTPARTHADDSVDFTDEEAPRPTPLPSPTASASPLPLEDLIYLELVYGRVVIRTRPDLAPKTVARMKTLCRQRFFDGIIFHRVIDNFMAQGGDPVGTGVGGSGRTIPAEFSSAKHVRGTVNMARSEDINSADSQFCLFFAPAPWLDGQYTIWGDVISGMEHVDKIHRGEPPLDPDNIVTMRVAADVEAVEAAK